MHFEKEAPNLTHQITTITKAGDEGDKADAAGTGVLGLAGSQLCPTADPDRDVATKSSDSQVPPH